MGGIGILLGNKHVALLLVTIETHTFVFRTHVMEVQPTILLRNTLANELSLFLEEELLLRTKN